MTMRSLYGVLGGGIAIVAASVACSSAPAAPPPSPFKTDLNVQQLMQLVVEPAADRLWTSVATVITEKGVDEIFPQNDEEWEAVRHGAAVLVESGNLLMLGSRPKDNEDWLKMSAEMTEAATAALKAAESKNPEAVFKTGGDVYQACTNCHRKYWSEDPRAVF